MNPPASSKKSTQGYTSYDYISSGIWSSTPTPPPPPPDPPLNPYTYTYTPAPEPVPPPPPPPPSHAEQKIKIATSDLFITTDPVMSEEDLAFNTYEQISGMAMLELTRSSAVNGINQKYLPIAGLADLNLQYDPTNIIALQNIDVQYFNQFPIILNNFIPSVGTGPNGEIVYIDTDPTSPTYNDLIINVIGLRAVERVEVEFLTFDELLNDTIIET